MPRIYFLLLLHGALSTKDLSLLERNESDIEKYRRADQNHL